MHTVMCPECRASFKHLSVRHLKEHGLDGRSYRIKYGVPRTQPFAAKEVTSRRKEMVQQSRPWEKAPTFVKAQNKAQKVMAQSKRTVRKKAEGESGSKRQSRSPRSTQRYVRAPCRLERPGVR